MNLYRVGYIFSIQDSGVVVMTDDLEFFKIKHRSDMLELGQQISFSESELIKVKSRRVNFFRVGAIASGLVAAIAILYFALPIHSLNKSNDIYAYIDVDTNLSVRLNIDENNKVITVDSNNINTKKVLNEIDFKDKTLSDALSTIVEKSKQCGFSVDSKEEYIVISASLKSDASKNEVATKLDKLVENVNKDVNQMNNLNANKKVLKVDSKTCQIASENNVSMGRYITYIETKSKGIDVSIDDIREGSLGYIINKVDSGADNADNVDNSQKVTLNKDTTSTKTESQHTQSKNKPDNDRRNDKRVAEANTPKVIYAPYPTNTISTNMSAFNPQNTSTPNLQKPPFINTSEPTPNIYTAFTPVPSVQNTTVINTPVNGVDHSLSQNMPTSADRNNTPANHHNAPVNVSINKASQVTANSALISGEVISSEQNNSYYNNFSNISLIYWEANNPSFVRVAASTSQSKFPATISATLNGLKPQTIYQYQIIVNFYYSSSVQTFTTLSAQTVTPNSVSSAPTAAPTVKNSPASNPTPKPSSSYPAPVFTPGNNTSQPSVSTSWPPNKGNAPFPYNNRNNSTPTPRHKIHVGHE
ncbi:MAG: anti-sigma factor domain-containing protein [Bacillota bacterium]|nr:anti-sigma factor domain-containing protein [Bacillota bacterium]